MPPFAPKRRALNTNDKSRSLFLAKAVLSSDRVAGDADSLLLRKDTTSTELCQLLTVLLEKEM
jgi:hypothetical protein